MTLTPAAAIPAEDALDGKDLVVMKYGADDAAGTKLTDVWSKVTDEGGDPTGAIYATFKLKHGERIVITGIPRNTGYTVAETRRDGYNLEHVTTDPHDENSESIQPTTDREGTVSGTITAEDKEIYLLYVNAKAPELPFTGSARGDMGMRIIMGAGIFLMAASSAVIFILRKKRGSYVK